MGIPSRVSKRAQYSISQVKNIGNWPKNATFSLRKSPKYANFSLLSFLRNFASIFAKLISQNGFLHFAKFRETCHSNYYILFWKNCGRLMFLPIFIWKLKALNTPFPQSWAKVKRERKNRN